jgi:hypothetical protein
MNKFDRGKIYTIRSHKTPLIYVGSTIEKYLGARMAKHKYDYKLYKNGNKKYVSSFYIFELDRDCYIELYEYYPCNTGLELKKREGEIIRELNCCNKQVAGRTQKEYREDNKEKIKANNKQYRENKKEYLKEQSKKYRENNKEKIKKRKNQKHLCECGISYTHSNKSRHLKTNKHQTYLSTKTD